MGEIEHRRQLLVSSEFLLAAVEEVGMKTRTRMEATQKKKFKLRKKTKKLNLRTREFEKLEPDEGNFNGIWF